MSQHTTIPEVPEPPFDFIDFPVSDSYRDHFAAQGLTYPSGRKPPLPASSEVPQKFVPPPDDQRREAEIQRFEERIKRLEVEVRALQKNRHVPKKNQTPFSGIPAHNEFAHN